MKNREGLRTWIEVDTKALEHNYHIFRGIIPKATKLCAVVKSNAYGHGLIDAAKTFESFGADVLAVDSAIEAINLRKAEIKSPILILGYTLPERLQEVVEGDLEFSVSTFELLEKIIETSFSKTPKIHIKVDTGMGRQGFLFSEAEKLILFLKEHSDKVDIVGLFTHFSSAKNPAFPAYTLGQIREFEKWQKAFADNNFSVISHCSATASMLLFPQTHMDMVRIGIGLYGEWPSKETRGAYKDKYQLKSALTWKTIISEIKALPKGSRIGYDATETLNNDSTIAVCPIGYWHGYPRSLSGITHCLINGQEVRVLGRVSMGMIVLDVTSVDKVKVGDEVVVLGGSISATYLGDLSGTSNYEIITRINPLIHRIYT